MPYQLEWEPAGVYRRYHGDVTIAERRASFEAICAHPRFDRLRYTVTDYLDVQAYEANAEATNEIAAMHIGPLLTNPRIVIAAVATRPDILALIEAFRATGYASAPYRVFARLPDARQWLSLVLDDQFA